jgi:hypothetical protein
MTVDGSSDETSAASTTSIFRLLLGVFDALVTFAGWVSLAFIRLLFLIMSEV